MVAKTTFYWLIGRLSLFRHDVYNVYSCRQHCRLNIFTLIWGNYLILLFSLSSFGNSSRSLQTCSFPLHLQCSLWTAIKGYFLKFGLIFWHCGYFHVHELHPSFLNWYPVSESGAFSWVADSISHFDQQFQNHNFVVSCQFLDISHKNVSLKK